MNTPPPLPPPCRVTQETATNKLRAQNEIRQRKVAAMEATFARIRQATGVNTLEEMVLKLANQSTNHTTLEEEKREAESKLQKAKVARQNEDTRFSYMKASGVGNTELNRDISDKLNGEIQGHRVEVRNSGTGKSFRALVTWKITSPEQHLTTWYVRTMHKKVRV